MAIMVGPSVPGAEWPNPTHPTHRVKDSWMSDLVPHFPGASPQVQAEVNSIHDFVLARAPGVECRLKAGHLGIQCEYSHDGFRSILCRIAVHGGTAFLDLGRSHKRAPLFDVGALGKPRVREFVGLIFQVNRTTGHSPRRRSGSPPETRVTGVSLPPQDDRDIDCPICGSPIWIWRLDYHAATTHGVRLGRGPDRQGATCLTCGNSLKFSEVQHHACPGDHPRSIWTISGGGGPGTGKRR